jgi:hypothetical protein
MAMLSKGDRLRESVTGVLVEVVKVTDTHVTLEPVESDTCCYVATIHHMSLVMKDKFWEMYDKEES